MEQVEMAISDFGGDNAGKISVSEKLFARAFVDALVSQAVRASLAGGRQGTRAQKNRTAVRHTRRKMFRQKGTGRGARRPRFDAFAGAAAGARFRPRRMRILSSR